MTDAATSRRHALDIQDVVVEAGRKRLVDGVSLSLEEGQHALLVGPSGCGKTSLLRAIAGLVPLTSGRIALFGDAANEGRDMRLEPAERGVGLLFQGGALWPHMSARRTLDFVLKRRGTPRGDRRRRIGELLELVDLAGFEKRRASTLSGGEAQRLGLARALASEPRLLLLDEPLGPLDAPRRQALLDRLHDLQERLGLTVLHVTHDPDEASRIAHVRFDMAEGRVGAGASVEA